MEPITTTYQFEQYWKAARTPTAEYFTKWAIAWAKNVRSFGKTEEEHGSRFRYYTIDAQQRYEEQLHGVMHHRSHQQEF